MLPLFDQLKSAGNHMLMGAAAELLHVHDSGVAAAGALTTPPNDSRPLL